MIELAFLDEFLVDDLVEIRIESPVMDLALVVLLKFVFDHEAMWLVLTGDHVQQVALKYSEIVHI